MNEKMRLLRYQSWMLFPNDDDDMPWHVATLFYVYLFIPPSRGDKGGGTDRFKKNRQTS